MSFLRGFERVWLLSTESPAKAELTSLYGVSSLHGLNESGYSLWRVVPKLTERPVTVVSSNTLGDQTRECPQHRVLNPPLTNSSRTIISPLHALKLPALRPTYPCHHAQGTLVCVVQIFNTYYVIKLYWSTYNNVLITYIWSASTTKSPFL